MNTHSFTVGRGRLGLLTGLTLAALGCGTGGGGGGPGPQGQLHVATSGLTADVAGVLYEIVCDDGTTVSEYVPLEAEGLPAHVDPQLAGEAFADLFELLPPGHCVVTATAMSDPTTPAEGCSPVSEDVTIVAGVTTEVVLVIYCEPDPLGGLDVVVVVVDRPSIIDIDYATTKFLLQCEETTVTVGAEGGVGALSYAFAFTSVPPGAVFTWSSAGPVLTFAAETPGLYLVTVTVSDSNGASSQFTFPIHVSDDPDIEHCDETCCRLADGHVFFGSATACETAGGVAVPDAACAAELCCRTTAGPAIVPAADCPQGAVLDPAACLPGGEVCCGFADGTFAFAASADACAAAGGGVVPAERCSGDVCCKLDPIQVVPADQCPAGQVLPLDACAPKPVCCDLAGAYFVLPDTECLAEGGLVAPDERCQPLTCCELPDGSVQVLPEATCALLHGAPAGQDLCAEVCCRQFEQGVSYLALALLGNCLHAGGIPLDPAECEAGQAHVWTANYTLDPAAACEPEPYLVVPSSGANQLAVYDLTTLQPLPTTPFNTCANPSRILMDGNTDVYASCRSDGKVAKHTRNGVPLWTTQLPNCLGARGIALSGNGRLFAGCSDAGYGLVFELDPATGTIVNSVDTGHSIYGLAVDADGVYAASYFESFVTKIHLGGVLDMTVAWSVPEAAYGITADAVGRVWLGGSTMLRALSTLDGSLVDSVSTSVTIGGNVYNPWLYGVMVGLDGNVYGATMQNFIIRYDPVGGIVTGAALDPAANGNRGLTLDVGNNVYSINLFSNSLTKTTPAGVSTGFGDDAGTVFLVSPYGYSGDMTGITAQCIAGTSAVWYSTPIDSGSPTTVWQTITWTATTPPGSGVALYTSIDGGVTWTQATNGQFLGLTAQILRVKAILSATIPGNEPTLNNVTVTYQ